MSIVIVTKLDKGIYASEGGGQRREYNTWRTTARGLFAAVREIAKHRAMMVRCYGNIGCGGSWIEIDGRAVGRDDEQAIEIAAEMADRAPVRTAVEEAQSVLDRMAKGVTNA